MAAGPLRGKGGVRGNAAERAGPLALFGWVLFDWATQPFYTLVVTFLFGPYFVNGFIKDPALGATLWAYATGGAELVAALLAPVLGSIADAGFARKPWIAGFSVLLVVGLCGLWLAVPGQTGMAPLVLLSFALATIGAELATVFNNAMMPSLVSHKRLGTLSGIGWAAGYVGGLVSLVLVAGFIVADPDTGKTVLGLDPIMPVDAATRADERLVGPFSALWYLIFVLPLFLFTPDRPGTRAAAPVKTGITQLFAGAKDLYLHHRQIGLFLLARMLYADGLGAVYAFGGIYAASVFGWGASELGLFGIILTIAGTIGAALGGTLDDHLGSKRVIGWALLRSFSPQSACFRSTRPMCCSFIPSSPRHRAARLSPRLASRSISPLPSSSGSPRGRSRRRAARSWRGSARPRRPRSSSASSRSPARSLPSPPRLPSARLPPRLAASASASARAYCF